MITLHHLNNSRSTRIIWLLEELQLDYQLIKYQRNSDTQLAPDELKRIHPLGKAPALQDGLITVVESGAIIEYLIHKYDKHKTLKPSEGSEALLEYVFWLHFAEGSAMPPMLLSLVFSNVVKRSPKLIKPIAKAISGKVMEAFIKPNIDRHNQLIEDTLASKAWFAGDDLTGADIQMSFIVEAIKARSQIQKYPNMQQWLQKVRSRPAYQVALAKGGELHLG